MKCKAAALLSDNNSTEDFLEQLQALSMGYNAYHGYICTILCIFGLLTNLVNIIVLTRPHMRNSINLLLASIAICDAGTMGTYLVYVIHFNLMNRGRCFSELYTRPWLYFILFHSLCSILLHTASLWFAVLLAILRLAVLQKNYLGHKLLKLKSVLAIMVPMVSVLVVLWIPSLLSNEVVPIMMPPCHTENLSNYSSSYTIEVSSMALRNQCLLLRLTLWINGLIFKLFPCLFLVVTVGGLLRSIHKAKLRNLRVLQRAAFVGTFLGEAMVGGCDNHAMQPVHRPSPTHYTSRTTKLLTGILIIFLVTEIPQAVVAVMSGLYPADMYFHIYPRLGNFLDLFSLINSGVNFVLYCGMSSRFRATFSQLFIPAAFQRFVRTGSGTSQSSNHGLVDLGMDVSQASRTSAGPRLFPLHSNAQRSHSKPRHSTLNEMLAESSIIARHLAQSPSLFNAQQRPKKQSVTFVTAI